MATLSQRVVQLALHGYDVQLIATTLGITSKEVVEVLENQSHQLTGGEGGGVPRDEAGRPILPALYAHLAVPQCPLNLFAEGFIPILGEGSIGHATSPPLTLQAGPCTVPAGQLCFVLISGPHAFGPLDEVEYVITNLDGSETLSAVAEHIALPTGIGPSAVGLKAADLNVFGKDGTDLTVHPDDETGLAGTIVTAAGGTFFIRCVLQLPQSS